MYQSDIIHNMSKQKVWDSIFIKDDFKTDYVLEFCYVKNNDINNFEKLELRI